MDRILLTDSPDDAIARLAGYARDTAGLKLVPRPMKVLGEKPLAGGAAE